MAKVMRWLREMITHQTTDAEAAMRFQPQYDNNQFWYDAQVDSFIKTFRCYCDWQLELKGIRWWNS